MAWNVEGTYFENCSCDSVCPCTTSADTAPADTERCRIVLAFHVATGAVDDLDVGGHTVVLVADTPPVMADSDWRLGLIIDDAASAEQADALGGVFGGQVGGPMAALAPLIGEMLGVERQPITFTDDGRRHSLRVGDVIDIEIEDFVPPQLPDGDVARLTGMFHPANSTLTIARAERARVAAFGMEWDNSGKNGHSAPFAWSA